MEKVYLTWDDINNLVDKLANEASQAPVPPHYITGLPRGGLIPAVMLSHKFRYSVCKYKFNSFITKNRGINSR